MNTELKFNANRTAQTQASTLYGVLHVTFNIELNVFALQFLYQFFNLTSENSLQ